MASAIHNTILMTTKTKDIIKVVSAIIVGILAVMSWQLDQNAKTEVWKVVGIGSIILWVLVWAVLWKGSDEKGR